ncbi:hypothetical protein [Paenibacillus sp.]|nr:hypothetical protein [Paenibacillus sp.]
MDMLRHDIVFASKDDGHGRMHDLAAVSSDYKVTLSKAGTDLLY